MEPGTAVVNIYCIMTSSFNHPGRRVYGHCDVIRHVTYRAGPGEGHSISHRFMSQRSARTLLLRCQVLTSDICGDGFILRSFLVGLNLRKLTLSQSIGPRPDPAKRVSGVLGVVGGACSPEIVEI